MTESTVAVAARILARLPGVSTRAEFGDATFLVSGVRFAALTGERVLMRLPPTELVEALRTGLAKPFVSVGAMSRNGWVELRRSGVDPVRLEELLVAAHAAARHSHRRTASRRPPRARHRRRSPT